MKKKFKLFIVVLFGVSSHAAETNTPSFAQTNTSSRLLRPLSLAEALDLALQQNSAIRKSRADLEATYGVIVQTRAIAWPKVGVSSSYSANEDSSTDKFMAKGGGSRSEERRVGKECRSR